MFCVDEFFLPVFRRTGTKQLVLEKVPVVESKKLNSYIEMSAVPIPRLSFMTMTNIVTHVS